MDLGPHALSVLVPLLGPLVEVRAVEGPRGIVHVLATHRGGAASILALTLDAAPAAAVNEFIFIGERGAAVVPPGGDVTTATAFANAIDQLLGLVAGDRAHPGDVHFGRWVVTVLAAAEAARGSGCAVAVQDGRAH